MATAKVPNKDKETTAPVYVYRMRGISVAVFANKVETKDGREIELHNISVQRRYRDGDVYKTTSVFRRDDLPVLHLLVQRAWHYVLDRENIRGESEDESE